MNRRDGKETLLDPGFLQSITGGLLVEFNGGDRVVGKIGWIDEIFNNSKGISIRLALCLYRNKNRWELTEAPEEIKVSIPVEKEIGLFSYHAGAESHFVPPFGNHFSVYASNVLSMPDLAGSVDGLHYYQKIAQKAQLLTREEEGLSISESHIG